MKKGLRFRNPVINPEKKAHVASQYPSWLVLVCKVEGGPLSSSTMGSKESPGKRDRSWPGRGDYRVLLAQLALKGFGLTSLFLLSSMSVYLWWLRIDVKTICALGRTVVKLHWSTMSVKFLSNAAANAQPTWGTRWLLIYSEKMCFCGKFLLCLKDSAYPSQDYKWRWPGLQPSWVCISDLMTWQSNGIWATEPSVCRGV